MSAEQRMVDLTLTLSTGMRGVEIVPRMVMPRDPWNASLLQLYSHAGTHMDAPVHYGVGSAGIDSIPLERLLRPAWLVRIADAQPRQLITLEHLGAISGFIQPGDGLLLQTGWSRFKDDPGIYRDQMPRISEPLARWCVDWKINLLGVEPPAVADPHNHEEIQLIHRILLGGDVLIVEGLTNLDTLREERVLFGAFPLKIEHGDGCPCRAFAIEENIR